MGAMPLIHMVLHFAVPAAIAASLRGSTFLHRYGLLMLGLAIDADHLLADPINDPLRCSMGFHPLHTWPAALVYVALCVPSRTRLVGIGLVVHMLLDSIDCLTMSSGASALRGFLPW